MLTASVPISQYPRLTTIQKTGMSRVNVGPDEGIRPPLLLAPPHQGQELSRGLRRGGGRGGNVVHLPTTDDSWVVSWQRTLVAYLLMLQVPLNVSGSLRS